MFHIDTDLVFLIHDIIQVACPQNNDPFLEGWIGINNSLLFKGPTYEYDGNTIQTRAPLSTENTNAFSW